MNWNLPLDGHCRCEKVRFRITAPPLFTTACHCTGCQRMTASAFSLSTGVPAAGFEVTQGEPVIGGLHGPPRHFHCDYCKSWLFTRPAGMDHFVNVRSSMLTDTSVIAPFMETFTAEKLPWAQTGAVHSYETMPRIEEFEPLMAEFATWFADR